MEAIGYGIIIGALIALGIVAGGLLVLQIKGVPNWKPLDFLNDKGEEEEIMQAGRVKPANYDEGPTSAEEFHSPKFKRDSFHEELPSAKGN